MNSEQIETFLTKDINTKLKNILIWGVSVLVVGLILGIVTGWVLRQRQLEESLNKIFVDLGTSQETSKSIGKSELKNTEPMIIKSDIGQIFTVDDYDMIVNRAEVKDSVKGEYYQPCVAKEGAKFIVVNLGVTNKFTEEKVFDNALVNVEDANGYKYKEFNTYGCLDNDLDNRRLAPLITELGDILFEVPSTIQGPSLSMLNKTKDSKIIVDLQLN